MTYMSLSKQTKAVPIRRLKAQKKNGAEERLNLAPFARRLTTDLLQAAEIGCTFA